MMSIYIYHHFDVNVFVLENGLCMYKDCLMPKQLLFIYLFFQSIQCIKTQLLALS